MKRLQPTVVITLAALGLAACSAGMTVSQRAYVACSGYTAALSTLAAHKAAGRLSDGVIRRVDEARAVVNPLCGQAVTSHADLDAIERGVKNLLDIKEKADG